MRNMAYVVEVTETLSIEGKDRIQIVKNGQNGYSVIGSKSIKVGDKLIYIEVDSILPEVPAFEFLRKRCYKEALHGFLIKNMKMNGIYSNGLLLTFEEANLDANKYCKLEKDLTDVLNIRKYEPEEDASPVDNKLPEWKKTIKHFLMRHTLTRWFGKRIFNINGKISGDFPTHLISKSDETNIQNAKQLYELHKEDECYITEKMEGQSVTLVVDPKSKKFGAYNRNSYGNPTVQDFVSSKKFDKTLKGLKEHYAVQGEFCAPTVQKGIYKNGRHFYVYLVKNLDTMTNLSYQEMINFCSINGFEHVPVIMTGKLGELFHSVEEMQEFTEHQWFKVGEESKVLDDRFANGMAKPDYHRCEGMVVRNIDESWSFKVKSNEYQLAGL